MASAALLDRFRADLAALGSLPDPAKLLGVAVSGGPDSLALLLLADAAFPGAVSAVTIDHGLRADAADEARAVATICASLGVPHSVLAAERDAAERRGSVQERARRLRYRLLGRWAAERDVGWIATAHHLDDQAETFLMRAARGAGASGLAGVRPRAALAGVSVPIVRPLLGWRRAELAGIVAAAGLTPVDDPSNRDPAHDRTAFRALLAATPILPPERLARAAANLADVEEALGWAAAGLAAERLQIDGRTVTLDAAGLPRELRRRLVIAALAHVAGPIAPRGDAVDELIRRLESSRAATLAGVAAKAGAIWRFAPAPARRG